MQSRFRRIQNLLTPLRILEAAARHGSFTKTAAELGLSQPSVSRHIASLEQDLGTTLFQRNHNKLSLTKDGRMLANSVDMGLSHILTTVQDITVPTLSEGLTLACTPSFANGWLLPRFSSLRSAVQNQPINLIVSYELKDIAIEELDLIISSRTDGWTDWPRLPLFSEVVYPVCAPGFLVDHPEITSPDLLMSAKLLNYDVRENPRIGWESWFAYHGLVFSAPDYSYQFSNYHFMIQAAIEGEGVALGWHHFVADHISAERLVKVGPAFELRQSIYTLEHRQNDQQTATISQMLEWFREQTSGLTAPD